MPPWQVSCDDVVQHGRLTVSHAWPSSTHVGLGVQTPARHTAESQHDSVSSQALFNGVQGAAQMSEPPVLWQVRPLQH